MTAGAPTAGSAATSTAERVDRPWIAIVQGMVGSFMLVFGSLGVGWLATSSELRRVPLIIWLRLDLVGVVLSILALALGGMLLMRSWLRLGQRLTTWGTEARRATLWATLAWGGPMLLTIPLFSRDVYAYIVQGKVMLNGLNPYVDGFDQITGYLDLGADDLWSRSPTPYGPVFLWLEELVVSLTGGHPELSVLLFRLLAVVGILLCIYAVPRLAALHGINPVRALWLTAANPLFLTNFVASVHNDALMLGLALVGLYLAATKRGVWGVLFITASVGIKPITIIFLPFIGLLWAGKRAGWGRRIIFWILTAGICLGLLGVMGVINGFGFGWVGALSTPGSVWIWYAPAGFAGMTVGTVAAAFGLSSGAFAEAVHLIFRLASVAIIGWQVLVGSYERIVRRLTIAFAALVVLAPMIQSWYIVWLIPLFAVTGIRNDWQVKTLYLTTAFFMVYAISDQLDIFPYLAIDLNLARNIAAVVAVAFGLYLVFIDRRTKVLFRKRWAGTQSAELY